MQIRIRNPSIAILNGLAFNLLSPFHEQRCFLHFVSESVAVKVGVATGSNGSQWLRKDRTTIYSELQ